MLKVLTKAQMIQECKERTERWAHLTEGISNDYTRMVTEQLLDNTKRYVEEETTTSAVNPFTTYAFPLIRRIFPKLIANRLVSVQAMPMPTGMIFYVDYKYSKNLAPTASGDRMDIQNYGNTGVANRGKFNPYYTLGGRGEVPTGLVNSSNTVFTTLQAPIKNPILYVNAVPVSIASFVASTGAITASAAPATGATVTVDYDFSFENSDTYPEVELGVTEDSVTVTERRLKAQWTLEAQQDMMAYHGLDVESELVGILGDEIGREIDRSIVLDLLGSAGANVNWHTTYPGTSSGYSKNEYDNTLFGAICDAATEIYKKRQVYPNWIVTDPDTASRMEKLNSFKFVGDINNSGTVVKGINLFGTIQNKYDIFVDPLFTAGKILMGYKGGNFMETGYVYAPYIPLTMTQTFMDTNFKPRKAVMTRYGKKLVSSDFYATVSLIA